MSSLLPGLALSLGLPTLLWLVSVKIKDASIIDLWWGAGFVALAWFTAWPAEAQPARSLLLLGMVTLWGLRLSLYLAWRNLGHGEDYRYQDLRKRYAPFWIKSLFIVFWAQGLLIWVVGLPLQAAMLWPGERPLGGLDLAGAALFGVGLFFEVVGDAQLTRFKADPANKGRVLDTGLWRYTRHPNYFGDFCVWWGLFAVGLSAGHPWTVVGPLIMTWLLTRVSGVPLLEKKLGETRPGYREYVETTNAFFPGPRRAR